MFTSAHHSPSISASVSCDTFGNTRGGAARESLFARVEELIDEILLDPAYPTPRSASASVFDSTDDAAYAAGAPSSTTTLWVAPS
jgi:hypothetical protein